MTDLKIDRNLGAKILALASGVAFAAGLVVLWLPHPALRVSSAKNDKAVNDLVTGADQEKADFAAFDKANRARTWSCSQEEVGPTALATATRLAKQYRLKLTTFRPQKAVELKGVTEMPFLMALEGTFLDIESFLKELQKPEVKLVPDLFQLAAGDQSVESVTATITVAAFWQPPAEVKKAAAGAKAGSGASSGTAKAANVAGTGTGAKTGPSIEVKTSRGTGARPSPSSGSKTKGGTDGSF
jgi:hypothetical protein